MIIVLNTFLTTQYSDYFSVFLLVNNGVVNTKWVKCLFVCLLFKKGRKGLKWKSIYTFVLPVKAVRAGVSSGHSSATLYGP